MYLALAGLYRAKWSAGVHEEWIAALLRNRPDLSRQKLERARQLMDLHAIDALVTKYEYLIPRLRLPDPNDRHVLAAAVRGKADVLVTANLRHFPASTLEKYGIEPLHPDTFLGRLLDNGPMIVVKAAEEHRISLKNPPKTIDQYLGVLANQGLKRTVARLRRLYPASSTATIAPP